MHGDHLCATRLIAGPRRADYSNSMIGWSTTRLSPSASWGEDGPAENWRHSIGAGFSGLAVVGRAPLHPRTAQRRTACRGALNPRRQHALVDRFWHRFPGSQRHRQRSSINADGGSRDRLRGVGGFDTFGAGCCGRVVTLAHRFSRAVWGQSTAIWLRRLAYRAAGSTGGRRGGT